MGRTRCVRICIQKVTPQRECSQVELQLLGFRFTGLPEGGSELINKHGLGRGQTGPVDVISFAITHHAVPTVAWNWVKQRSKPWKIVQERWL